MTLSNIKQYQTVSIWITGKGDYAVRGYYRAASYQLSRHTTLDEAVSSAFAVPRKQSSIALVPKWNPEISSEGHK
ncbi:hypothetical protein [Paracoccus rhizosphaerae]|uniref:KTSC domain-containing protein n=1 Tax=Paracoccus rhizosphaerae TaxID=1133347 RepID=A0ABV6CEU1_9RHOB|nr:hypothetical protein [Paracoccus rhizosphaerae]